VKQKGGKAVHAWAFAGDCDPDQLRSNTFEIEWPPKSGKTQEFPEIDRAEFFDLDGARKKMNPAQVALVEELVEKVR
jgi:predicted NUDIX family NTP pyrophosphohydrolase